ncbi:MAG TPA: T9SS type A sorting domain-containing protein [Bacteroidia bacterium]|jgi:hypothetical protein
MIKKFLLFVFIPVFSISVSAQGEADHWYFGVMGGLDFSNGTPVAVSGSLNSSEGTASISSAAGNLMFYTDGVTVWDSSHTAMSNGSGLMGDVSTTQSAIIIPSPGSASRYYVFTLAADGGAAGFRYSIVDMTLNGGMGDVTPTKNIFVTDSITEKICAIRDANETGYWITIHKWGTNQFYSYHLTSSGLSAPVISSVGSVHTTSAIQNTYGQMKFNMCGDKLALTTGYLNTLEIFDFDINTGMVSNPMIFSIGYHVYGVEFAKGSGLLYLTSYNPSSTLTQYDITLSTQAAIDAAKIPLSVTPDLYALQIGPDGKIYVAQSFSNPFIGVINNPDIYGFGANYVENAIHVDPMGNGVMAALGLPAFMQNYLKKNVTCAVGIEESNAEHFPVIYPNPTAGEFNIRSSGKSLISIYDYTGRLIESIPVNGNAVFGKDYAAGIYLVVCRPEQKGHTFKIIKE